MVYRNKIRIPRQLLFQGKRRRKYVNEQIKTVIAIVINVMEKNMIG